MWMLGTEPGSSAKQPVLLIFEPFPVLSMGEQDSHLFVGRAILKERGTRVLSDLPHHCPRHSFCSIWPSNWFCETYPHLVSWAQFYISVLQVSRYGFCDRDIEL